MPKSKHAQYIVTDLKAPTFTPGFAEKYARFAKRILWMDQNVVPGAFQMNVSWYLHPNDDHAGSGIPRLMRQKLSAFSAATRINLTTSGQKSSSGWKTRNSLLPSPA